MVEILPGADARWKILRQGMRLCLCSGSIGSLYGFSSKATGQQCLQNRQRTGLREQTSRMDSKDSNDYRTLDKHELLKKYEPLKNVMELYLQPQNDNEKPLSIGMFKRVQEHKETNIDEQHTNGTFKHEQDHKKEFKSTLEAYVNVLGPKKVNGTSDDLLFVTRRATLLRSLLKRMLKIPEDQKIYIAPNVLNALLSISEFRHGSRSIEFILNMSEITMKDNKCSTEKHLPPKEQRELHVDGTIFDTCLVEEPPREVRIVISRIVMFLLISVMLRTPRRIMQMGHLKLDSSMLRSAGAASAIGAMNGIEEEEEEEEE
ncbi:hypothetical protein SI65_03592 [Aspergillus cristatus]|uniref:Uncharacterized protein n=1 Tax=Aspergillus cristatus TaxID=573508 RepID=A0A1E3BHW3_ASPCR|nr:hypothetical protein SI65_03592 [Aspergillus cristatus]